MKNKKTLPLILAISMLALRSCSNVSDTPVHNEYCATGDLGVVIERATGEVQIVNHTSNEVLSEISGLGDLSHASIVYSRDQLFAYVFERDGSLTKIDLLQDKINKQIIQFGNSIGGAISQDGKLFAVSNYMPGGVKVFNSDTSELGAEIPASILENKEKNEDGSPYRSIVVSPDGRYYIAGLFGEDGMAMLDLWYPEKGTKRVLENYGKGDAKLPVYKMPHIEGWAIAGEFAFVPAVGQHKVLVVNTKTWEQVAEIEAHSQPIFVIAQPDGRQISLY